MMKYKEIIEHLNYKARPGFTWIDEYLTEQLINGTKLNTIYESFDIMQNGDLYGVIKNNKVYCFCQINLFKNDVFRLIKIESRKNENIKDMASTLFYYLTIDLGFRLLSDEIMSPDGTRFWQKIANHNKILVRIYDIDDDELYPIGDVGELTKKIPSVLIQSPDNDRYQTDIKENGTKLMRKHYRFFWLAEHIKCKSDYITQ